MLYIVKELLRASSLLLTAAVLLKLISRVFYDARGKLRGNFASLTYKIDSAAFHRNIPWVSIFG